MGSRDVSYEHVESIIARIGELVKRHREWLWRSVVLLLISWSAYNIGLIRAHRGALPAQRAYIQVRDGIVSRTPAAAEQGSRAAVRADRSDPRVVVSTSSKSKKYHYSWCSSGKRIKESNRLWFPTAADAEAAGYSLAGNCRP